MFLERFIHGEAFKARPDVNAVVHSHSPTVIPFTVTDEPLKAVSHIASFLAGGCPCFEIRDVGLTQGLLVTNNKQGAALAKVLGDRPVALMRGHGNLVVASDIPRVVHRALYTEVNARQLATALSFRRPIKYVEPDEMLRTRSGSAIPGRCGSAGDGGDVAADVPASWCGARNGPRKARPMINSATLEHGPPHPRLCSCASTAGDRRASATALGETRPSAAPRDEADRSIGHSHDCERLDLDHELRPRQAHHLDGGAGRQSPARNSASACPGV